MKSPEIIAAEWLIVGFVKSWSWQMLAIQITKETGSLPEDFKFLPSHDSYWQGAAPVRGYVQQNWPKLAEFLDKATPQKQIKAAEQVARMTWNGLRPNGCLNKNERSEFQKTRRDLRAATTSYRESRKNFQAHSGANWNVCS